MTRKARVQSTRYSCFGAPLLLATAWAMAACSGSASEFDVAAAGSSGTAGSSGSAGTAGSEGGSADGGSSGGSAGSDTSSTDTGGSGGTRADACDAEFSCDGENLVSCRSGETELLERCASAALCDDETGQCQPPTCEAGELNCTGRALEVCASDRAGFDAVELCDSAALCNPLAGACDDPSCEAGEARCSGATLEVCAEDRTGFVQALECEDAAACDAENALCTVDDCTPGAFQCIDSVLLTCSSNGATWELVESCANPALCNAEAGQCDSAVCEVNEFDCDAATLRVCSEDRTAFETSETCATSGLCNASAGQCDAPACGVGEYRCLENTLQICNADRTAFQVVEVCGEDETCIASPPQCAEAGNGGNIVGDLDGLLLMIPCSDTPSTDDCNCTTAIHNDGVQSCTGGQLYVSLDYPIGGYVGVTYEATLHFYGIVGPKNYGNGVMRDAGNGRPDLNGGEPTSWGSAPANHTYPGSNYETFELRVMDENDAEVAAYYLNADTQEGHYTMLLDWEKTIPIIGGGTVRFRHFDANCRQIKNCGTSAGYPCAGKARSIDVSAADPAPSGLDQPGLGQSADHAGEWLLIDVVDVTLQ